MRLQVAVAQSIAKISSHAQENDVGLEVAPFERVLLCHDEFLFLFSLDCSRSAYFLQHNQRGRVCLALRNVLFAIVALSRINGFFTI
jgi:hypothetical protein